MRHHLKRASLRRKKRQRRRRMIQSVRKLLLLRRRAFAAFDSLGDFKVSMDRLKPLTSQTAPRIDGRGVSLLRGTFPVWNLLMRYMKGH